MAWRFRPFGRMGGATGGAASGTTREPPELMQVEGAQPWAPGQTPATSETLVARFWGVRGSYPTPRVGAGVIGGETTCLEIRYGRHTLVIDAGSGAIALGEELVRRANANTRDGSSGQRQDITLLFTHAHHDHLCGLPFFAPLYDSRFHVRFFGPDLARMRFGDIIAGYMRAPYFPVDFRSLPARRSLRRLRDGDRVLLIPEQEPRVLSARGKSPAPPLGVLLVDAHFSNLHPADGTMVYRVVGGAARLVFATDVEIGARGPAGDRRLIEFARDADVLVHDAQYSEDDYHGSDPKRGFGHSTPAMAARVARDAGVGRLVLFHHEPHYSDEAVLALQRHASAEFAEVITAREGLELRLDGDRRRLV